MPDSFLPRDHWRNFETFALRVVEIKVRNAIIYDQLYSWRTKDTRDEGVDGHILLTMADRDLRITVEAKLRKDGKIALKDIASSLVNYLVNYSDIHFVVTNVCFTDDAYRIANLINSKGIFSVNYLDCQALSLCLEEYPELEREFPALADNIWEQTAKITPSVVKSESPSQPDALPAMPYLSSSRQSVLAEVLNAVRDRAPLIALYGPRGTDKSLVLEYCMRKLSGESPVIRMDMQYIDSLRTFLLALLKDVLGLDIFEYWELLSAKECESAWEDACANGTRDKIVHALRQLLNTHRVDDPVQENYFIQEFFSETAKINQTPRLLLLENLNMVTQETLLGLMNLFPRMVVCNFCVVVELSSSTPCGVHFIDANTWYLQIEQLKAMRLLGRSTKWITLEDLTGQEAIELLSHLTAQSSNSYFLQTLLRRFGRNPAVLREVSGTVVKTHITTTSELWNLPAPGSQEAMAANLFSVMKRVRSRGKDNYLAFRWCLQALVILYGYLSAPVIAAIEEHCLADGTVQALEQTGFVYPYATGDGWHLRSEREKAVLESIVSGWSRRELIDLLIQNRKSWAMPEVIAAYAEANMLLDRGDPLFLETAKKAIQVCLKNGEGRLAFELLRKCGNNTKNAVSMEKRYQHLDFALNALALDQKLGLSSAEERETEEDCLLRQCIDLHQNAKSKGTAELLIRCNLMKNNLLRDRFNFYDGEANIDICLDLAKTYGLDNWGAQAYVAKALCVKEQGSYTKCFEIFRQGVRAYPQNHYLRSCYLANYAAHQAKTDLSRAIQCGRAALIAAQACGDMELCCWVQEDLFMYRLETGENTPAFLKEIKECRHRADQYGFRADISRTYNLEGVFYAVKGEWKCAAQCFENSIQCYDASITDQQKFLFRSNLLAVLPCQSTESTECLEQQLLWLHQNHTWLVQKLLARADLSAETNFAAVLLILKAVQQNRRQSDFKKIQSWFPLDPITKMRYSKSLNLQEVLSHRFFPNSKCALILF